MDKNDLISRSTLLEEVIRIEGDLHMPNGKVMHVEGIPVSFVVEAPAIDPDELGPKGRWVYDDNDVPHCSICGGVDGLDREEYLIRDKIRDNASNYCPNCGVKMEGLT